MTDDAWREKAKLEEKIEAVIYQRAPEDPGFAIAYALVQVANALHGIEENIGYGSLDDGLEKIAEAIAGRIREE